MNVKHHAVMGRDDVIGRHRHDRVVIQVDMHVCHDPPRHARARQPFQRARQMRVAGMGIQPQGIADKDLGALDQGPGRVGDVRNVRQIDQATDAKASYNRQKPGNGTGNF